MIILVINCGSSSIKYQLFDMKSESERKLLAKGNIEKIGILPEVPDHNAAMKKVLDSLVAPDTGVLASLDMIDAVGHRVVQGADLFSESAPVTEENIEKVRSLVDLAPLHNPAHLLGISVISQIMPGVPQVMTFDTAFHQTMPPVAYMYALPYEYYTKYRVRRYGMHGTSHLFVSAEGARFAGIDLENSRIITCHIGSGSSITAIRNGKCIDTSMGFTPLEGMIMGTRCGSIDASIVPFLMKKENLTPDQITEILNRKSGFIGLSDGLCSDCRDMCKYEADGNERAKLVLDKLVFDITKIVGAYIAELGGLDLLVFTAGIAENNPWLRKRVASNFAYMGIAVDDEANDAARKENAIISTADSRVKVAMIPTDEEFVIARDTMRIVMKNKK